MNLSDCACATGVDAGAALITAGMWPCSSSYDGGGGTLMVEGGQSEQLLAGDDESDEICGWGDVEIFNPRTVPLLITAS